MKLKSYLPLLVFAVMAVALGVGLTLNPRLIPSALVGKPVPDFSLPPVKGRSAGLSTADLKSGEPVLVNVFASWCGPCRVEHPLIMALAKDGVTVHGLNQRDAQGGEWLDEFGDPYTRTGDDRNGRASIEWGVYGVPETFIVTGDGRIACKHIGPLMPHDIAEKIKPALADLKAKGTTDKCSAS
jgi:cytochrome c biogenesis protein CcmG/thiol:disulfide interchange protein DsbE